MMANYPLKYTYSKELMDLRSMEKKMFTLKEYIKAETFKKQADKMEQEERAKTEEALMIRIEKEEQKLRQR